MRLIVASFLLLFVMTGCSFLTPEPPAPEKEYINVPKPISVVPKPPNTDCPTTPLENISDEKMKVDGEVAKAYLVAALQYRDCSVLREKVIDKYRQMAEDDARDLERLKDRTNGPQSASGPVVNPGSGQSGNNQPYSFPAEALDRELRDNPFKDIEDEFKDLERKGYDIE